MNEKQELSTLYRSVSKPGRYTGGEYNQILKDKADVSVRFAFCFPDTYEIGMSNLGVRILYECLNRVPYIWCERVYAPWLDMMEKMETHNIPLSAMESGDRVSDFDIVAFTLQYELCYTTALRMLKLAGIPLLSRLRGEGDPIILGGGPCAYNAEPIADFFDIFSIGEGEEALPELCALYKEMKESGSYTREGFLHAAAKIEGFYVPSLYEVSYNGDGTIKSYTPKYEDVPTKIKKRIVADMDKAPFPEKFIVPYVETVHDRVLLEVYRGCIRGCRFCQAGMVYRPIREKSPDTLSCQARAVYDHTGYDEISLVSLSISDYSKIDELTDKLLSWTDKEKVSLSLPSLRVDSFTEELMQKIATVRTGGLTFAPEAGTQRMRDVINKNVTEDDLLRAVGVAFGAGKSSVKLYFMQGLPTETEEDLRGIPELAKKVVHAFYQCPTRNKSRGITVTISVSCFIPKPFTPFQWEGQDKMETLLEKQLFIKDCITDKKIRYNYHDAKVSQLEAVFARGDRRLAPVLLRAVESGIAFDAWTECFDYDKWMRIFEECSIDPCFYANRSFGLDEWLPWDIIDIGVTKAYLLRERARAYEGKTTPSCAEHCNGCGADNLGGVNRWCKR